MEVTLVNSSVYSLPSKQRVGCIVYDGTADGLAGALSDLQHQRVNGLIDFDSPMAARLTNKLSWNRRAAELDDALAVISSTGRKSIIRVCTEPVVGKCPISKTEPFNVLSIVCQPYLTR